VDDRHWRLDITRSANFEVVTTWRDDQLDDVAVPDWKEHIVAQLANAAPA